ncbi:DUF4232 domain-containing protein [Streptomyces olivoreticuli]|uniref:DUF4232 domain-containing protein n=1 Tax=Streptomyces olivoreticuli TaxID=68246 RepID=UPI000E283784|nr:DUF4232 domain-containing protein [Streptomyces olivoreticuli]
MKKNTGTVLAAGALTAAALAGTVAQAQAVPAGDPTAIAACSFHDTEVTVRDLPRPVNHHLLTLTNTGTGRCIAYGAPWTTFGARQDLAGVVEDSQPQSTVVLNPGQSAYAGILLSSAEGSDGHRAANIRVALSDRDGGEQRSGHVLPALPDTWVDNTVRVTYWQSDVDDAIRY